MKTSLKLTLSALALGLTLSSFAQDKANTPASTTKTSPKVMIQITDSSIKSGKILIKDGQVYIRIGAERTMDSGAVKADEDFFTCPGVLCTCRLLNNCND